MNSRDVALLTPNFQTIHSAEERTVVVSSMNAFGQALLAGLNIVTFPTPKAPRFKVRISSIKRDVPQLTSLSVRLVLGHGKQHCASYSRTRHCILT